MGLLRQLARELLPLSLRTGAQRLKARLHAKTALANVSHWEALELGGVGRPYRIVYVGLSDHRSLATTLFRTPRGEERTVELKLSEGTALATPAVLPRALRVPLHVQMIVPLQGTRDQVLERYDAQLRKRVRSQRARYSTRRITDLDELDLVTDTLLEPYARSRHGAHAIPLGHDLVRRVALGDGRLDLVYRDGAPIGCSFGYPRQIAGAKVWVLWRLGYPAEVFNDSKHFSDVNTLTTYLDLERVMSEGYDYYDMGSCIASPDDGLLQWKRRRGGAPSAFHTHEWLNVMLPRSGAALVLWDAPLFAAEERHLGLWLGLPAERTDDELVERCRFMRFDGLKRVHLVTEREPSRELVERLAGVFPGREHTPELVTVRAAA